MRATSSATCVSRKPGAEIEAAHGQGPAEHGRRGNQLGGLPSRVHRDLGRTQGDRRDRAPQKMQYTGELGQYFRRQVRCSQTSVVVAPARAPGAKNGGPTCLQTLALESASGAPLSSKCSIGSPTKGARSYSSLSKCDWRAAFSRLSPRMARTRAAQPECNVQRTVVGGTRR
jgi:hypothetical protein